jgi:hypothetical protein
MQKLLCIAAMLFTFLLNFETQAQTPQDLFEAWDKFHISNIFPSDTRHADLKNYLGELKKLEIKVQEVGKSYGNREIYQIEWGKGAIKVMMWSQMHGDEPTATPALIDMFAFLQKNRDKAWVKKLEETLTIRAVPMLNPDGSELFQRRNLQGIDINRDARNLQTPEARLLKQLRDEFMPHIGFNLHNQQSLTTVSGTTNQAAISFLVVEGKPELSNKAGNERNKRLTAAMVAALQNFIRGHIGRYVDSYNPDAFGDKFSDWGTNAILIETGALYGKDEMFLVKMNFIAFLTALNALADGSEKNFSTINYDIIPNNGSGNLFNFIFRRANIVNRSGASVQISVSDITVNTQRRRASQFAPSYVQSLGNFPTFRGLEEYDVSNFYLVSRFPPVRSGSLGEFIFYKKDRQIDWKAENLEQQFPPDAIFSQGKWLKGGDLILKK